MHLQLAKGTVRSDLAYFFWLCCVGCGIFCTTTALGARGPNHWTTMEFLDRVFLREDISFDFFTLMTGVNIKTVLRFYHFVLLSREIAEKHSINQNIVKNYVKRLKWKNIFKNSCIIAYCPKKEKNMLWSCRYFFYSM